MIATIVNTILEKWKTQQFLENQLKYNSKIIDIPIVCELVNHENERFIKHFSSCYCDSFACEMICNMVKHRYNNRIWLDFSTVTSDVTIINIPVPNIMHNYQFQSVYIYLLEKRIKCLGILKQQYGRYTVYSNKKYQLREDDILICVVKQHDTLYQDTLNIETEILPTTVEHKLLDPTRLNAIDATFKKEIEMESESSRFTKPK